MECFFSRVSRFIYFIILLTLSNVSLAQEIEELSTTELFSAAMQVKSSDIARSDKLIRELDRRSYLFDRDYEEQLFYLKAYQQLIKGNHEEAIRFHEKSIYSSNIEHKLRAYNNILYIDIQLNYFKTASQSIQPIIDILSKNNISDQLKINTRITLAYALNNLGDYGAALEHLGAINLVDNQQISGRDTCFINSQKIYAYFGLTDYNLGNALIAETSDICRQEGEIILVHRLIAEQAKAMLSQQQYSNALQLLMPYQQAFEDSKFALNSIRFNNIIATASHQLNNQQKALVFAKKVLTFKQKYSYRPELFNAAKIIYSIEKQNANIEIMFALQKQIVELEQTYVANEQEKIIALNRIEQGLSNLKWTISDYQLSIETETKTQELKQATIVQVEDALFLEQSANLILIGLILYIYKYMYKALLEKKDNERALLFQKDSNYPFRTTFIKNCEAMLQNAQLQQSRCSLIVLNIDNLRTINELQGNDRADRLILLFYRQFEHFIPQGSEIGCLGGDEFAFLIPNCPIRKAEAIAEKFRLAINYLDTRKVSYQFDVTASFGITDSLLSGFKFEQILMDAEKALLQAKQQYKNCVCRYSITPEDSVSREDLLQS